MQEQIKRSNFAWIMMEDILQVRRHEKNFILRGETEFREGKKYTDLIRFHLQKAFDEAKQYEQLSRRKEDIVGIDKVIDQLKLYENVINEFIARYENKNLREEIAFLISTGRALVDLVYGLKDSASSHTNYMMQSINNILKRQWFLLVSSLIIGTIVFWVMFRTIVVPIKKLQQLNNEIAHEGVIKLGQLQSVDELLKDISGKDEVGEVAIGYREMMIRCSNSYLGYEEKWKR